MAFSLKISKLHPIKQNPKNVRRGRGTGYGVRERLPHLFVPRIRIWDKREGRKEKIIIIIIAKQNVIVSTQDDEGHNRTRRGDIETEEG